MWNIDQQKRTLFLILLCCPAAYASAQPAKQKFLRVTAHFTVYINQDDELIVRRKEDHAELLKERLSEYEAAQYIKDTTYGQPYTINDYNFDGYDDLSFPSFYGNVQRFQQVYLYNSSRKVLEENAALSEVACIQTDKKAKTITGYCFHSSAAENWTETYTWRKGRLLLIGKEGTMPCAPDQNCYYTYRQKRIKGKMVFLYKTKNKI